MDDDATGNVLTIVPNTMREYPHGVFTREHDVAPEIFPPIRRVRRAYRTEDGIARYTVFSIDPDEVGMIVEGPDPALDRPTWFILSAHPTMEAMEAASRAMHDVRGWAGLEIMDSYGSIFVGEDRVWMLQEVRPYQGARSHLVIRRGLGMTNVWTPGGQIEVSTFHSEMNHLFIEGEGVDGQRLGSFHRYYAKDAPVPGTALHDPDRNQAEQMAEWFSRRLTTRLPDGSNQSALGIDVVLGGAGGVARAALLRTGATDHHVIAWSAKFAYTPGSRQMDTISWRETVETDGWSDMDWPDHLIGMLSPPRTEMAARWRRELAERTTPRS